MKLLNPSNDVLDAAFAQYVAWPELKQGGSSWKLPDSLRVSGLPRFTASADAVLPWLEKFKHVRICRVHHLISPGVFDDSGSLDWRVSIYGVNDIGEASSLPRAAVLALLRAHGVEIEFSK